MIDLRFGDCLKVMPELRDNSVNLIVTSPPYNVGVKYDAWDDAMDWARYGAFVRAWIAECYRVLADTGRIAINIPVMANNQQAPKGAGLIPLAPMYQAALQSAGFTLREMVTWVKTHANELERAEESFCGNSTAWGSWMSPSNPMLRSFSEYIIIAHKGAPKLAWRGEPDLTRDEFLMWSRNIWMMPTAASKEHPAIFPVELPLRLIKMYSYLGDVVLDPFMGRGTTGEAAGMNGRGFIGIEISPQYYEIARRRIEAARAQLPLFPICEPTT